MSGSSGGPQTGPSVVIAPDAACAAVARRHVAAVLSAAGRPDLIDTARLAVTELATNAALHARTEVTVTVRLLPAGQLRIEVADGSPVLPQEHPAPPMSTVGRGLHLLDSLGRWGADPVVREGRRVGKVVWFSSVGTDETGPPPVATPEAGDDDPRSILGRYAAGGLLHDPRALADEEDRPQAVVIVRLLNFPLRVFASAREHHDELMREFALLSLQADHDRTGAALPPRLAQLVDLLGRRYGAARQRGHPAREAALVRSDLAADLEHHVDPDSAAELHQLIELLAEAEEFSRQGYLLTMPSTPLQRRFVRWLGQEFLRQTAGLQPIPWDGPYDIDVPSHEDLPASGAPCACDRSAGL